MLKHPSILLIAASTLFISCSKKSGDVSDNGFFFIKAKIGGQEILYRENAAGRVENNKVHGDAFNHLTNNFPSFSFDIEAGTAIQTDTTYREASTNLIFRYSLSGTETYHSQMGNEMDFVIQVTQITHLIFKGTFSGTIRKANDINQSLQVTEGEFFLLKR
jgi:hypothetical protein